MNKINKDIRYTILKMVSEAKAAHIATAFSEVEILNSIYNLIDIFSWH